jgi:putative SbcD/Mre11-related phosphoesterase
MSVRFRDRAVYLPDAEALVLADLHVGRAAVSNLQLPVGERRDLRDRLDALCRRFAPTAVVFAGDLLEAFDHVPDGAERTLRELARAVRDHDARPVAVRGNHDRMLPSLWPGSVHDAYRAGDTLVVHGHEPPEAVVDGEESTGALGAVRRYIAGHDHPAITIEGQRHACYLRGEYRGTNLVLLPAFSRLPPGRAVNGLGTGEFLSPLVEDADALAPVVRDEAGDETREFPPLGEFSGLL